MTLRTLFGAVLLSLVGGCGKEQTYTTTSVRSGVASARPIPSSAFSALGTTYAPTRVELRILPSTLIRTETKVSGAASSASQYFVLAVANDSPFLADVSALDGDLVALGKEALGASKIVSDDKAFAALVAKVVDAQKRVQALHPTNGSDTIAIELAAFEESGAKPKWVTLIDDRPDSMLRLFGHVPGLEELHIPPMQIPGMARSTLERLAAEDPPDLEKPMPNIDDELNRDALVEPYNKELMRRRAYLADTLPGDVEELRCAVRVLGGVDRQIILERTQVSELAARTYQQSYGFEPAGFDREAGGSFAKDYFATTTVLVNSFPNGADVTLNGAAVGKTPLVLDKQKVAAPFALTVSQKGFDPAEENAALDVSANGFQVRRFHLKRTKKK
ncbi:MAG: PEGA domain-containing protein [Polyangiaceae bacterium]